jgi:hypothetical protein
MKRCDDAVASGPNHDVPFRVSVKTLFESGAGSERPFIWAGQQTTNDPQVGRRT